MQSCPIGCLPLASHCRRTLCDRAVMHRSLAGLQRIESAPARQPKCKAPLAPSPDRPTPSQRNGGRRAPPVWALGRPELASWLAAAAAAGAAGSAAAAAELRPPAARLRLSAGPAAARLLATGPPGAAAAWHHDASRARPHLLGWTRPAAAACRHGVWLAGACAADARTAPACQQPCVVSWQRKPSDQARVAQPIGRGGCGVSWRRRPVPQAGAAPQPASQRGAHRSAAARPLAASRRAARRRHDQLRRASSAGGCAGGLVAARGAASAAACRAARRRQGPASLAGQEARG